MSGFATFQVPDRVIGTAADEELGRAMTAAWRRDGIFQVAAGPGQRARKAMAASRRFFARPLAEKASCVNDTSYSEAGSGQGTGPSTSRGWAVSGSGCCARWRSGSAPTSDRRRARTASTGWRG